MTDSLDLLRRLRIAVMTRRLPDDVALWLQHGTDAYMTGSGPLDTCLGLKTTPGKRNHASVLRLAERDELIRRAARNMDGSAWQQAGVLVQAVSDLDAVQAAGINFKDGANRALLPPSLGGSRLTYLSEIRRCGMEVPSSQSQLYKILTGYRPQDTQPDVMDPCPCDGCSQRETCRQNGNECEAFRIWVDSESLHELRIS